MENKRYISKIIFGGLVTGIILQFNWGRNILSDKGLFYFLSINWLRIIASSLFFSIIFLIASNTIQKLSERFKLKQGDYKIENFFFSFIILLGYLFFPPNSNLLVLLILIIPWVYYSLALEIGSKSNSEYFQNLFVLFGLLLLLQISKDIIQLTFSSPRNYLFYTRQCIGLLLYLLIPVLFPKRIKIYAVGVLGVFFMSSLLTNVHVILYGTDITQSAYYAIWETSMTESLDYFKQIMTIQIVVANLLLLTVVIVFPYLFLQKITTNVPLKIRLLFFSLFICLTCLNNDYELNLPNKFYTSYEKFRIQLKTVQNQIEYRKRNPLTDQPPIICHDKNGASVIVMVIGESASKYHQGLYGYQRNTNPLLGQIRQDLIVFDSVISPHAQTNPVLSKVLTFANNENMDPLYTKRNLIEYMKLAGYKTYWFSNQAFAENFSTVATSIAVCADQYMFTSSNLDDYQNNDLFYDQLLFKPYKLALKDKAPKKFIVLHLMGSHSDKTKRFPVEFKKFNDWQGIPQKPYNSDGIRDVINAHDNSVLYNDWIVYNVIQDLKSTDTNAFFIYFSDHGEEMFEYRNFMGHAEGNASIYMMDIPCIAWMSDEYKARHPKEAQNLPGYLHRRYQTDDMIHTIINLSGSQCADYDSTRSLISPYFKFKKRLINGSDYDQMIQQGKKSIQD